MGRIESQVGKPMGIVAVGYDCRINMGIGFNYARAMGEPAATGHNPARDGIPRRLRPATPGRCEGMPAALHNHVLVALSATLANGVNCPGRPWALKSTRHLTPCGKPFSFSGQLGEPGRASRQGLDVWARCLASGRAASSEDGGSVLAPRRGRGGDGSKPLLPCPLPQPSRRHCGSGSAAGRWGRGSELKPNCNRGDDHLPVMALPHFGSSAATGLTNGCLAPRRGKGGDGCCACHGGPPSGGGMPACLVTSSGAQARASHETPRGSAPCRGPLVVNFSGRRRDCHPSRHHQQWQCHCRRRCDRSCRNGRPESDWAVALLLAGLRLFLVLDQEGLCVKQRHCQILARGAELSGRPTQVEHQAVCVFRGHVRAGSGAPATLVEPSATCLNKCSKPRRLRFR